MAAAAAMMMCDDDDAEPQLSAVERYYLLDSANHAVCFSTLPLRLGDTGDLPENKKKRLVLRGIGDPGIKVYQEVVAWRLRLEGKQPEIAVLSADGGWIRLLKPNNSYEEIVRTVLITVQMLHFLKRKSDEPEKNLWKHLRKAFDKFDVRPSEDDFRNHRSLMKQCAEKYPVLAKSEILQTFVEGRCRKNIEIGTDNIDIKQPFIADDDDIDDLVTEDSKNESDEEDNEDLFDSICAICDNGGDLLCCDGPCMRSFHAKEGTGEDSYCDTLGYNEAEVEAMKIFLCKNCEHKQHQCFVCGVLEPSDGAAAKVFLCNNATCGHFYHPKCVARQLLPNNKNEASELEKQISTGLSFTCPIHWCFHCKGLEDRTHEPSQFAVCRRCPKSYHRKCLPREISFEDIEEENITTRAWELSKRILIYCLDHEIDSNIDTPVRDHIIFPEIEKPAQGLKKRAKSPVKRKKRTYSESVLDQSVKDSVKMPEKVHMPLREHTKQTNREVSATISTKNLVDRPEKKKAKFLKQKIQLEQNLSNDPFLSSPKPAKEQDHQMVSLPLSATKKIPLSSFPLVDSETEKRVIALLGNEVPSLTIKDISRKCIVPSTHVYSGRQIERLIAQGKIERSVQAVGAALKKLDNGGNINDAKAVCEPDVLRQLAKWHSKLRVYISPFIHGTRYSSFGRHFTKVEKLVEIVDKLHCYVEPGDMIVDFCCGANDFSRLMKEKLDKVQKKCRFKNYDLIQPQDRFCFEKRDWMTVQPKELPRGSQLIMGLNPPFGVKASLANKFIDKALTFKPKLIVLIVPKETKRLDQKKTPYDLIWEDIECLAGKAFYLPGSVDLNDKTVEGWNASAPPLYLWSRPDWTKKHMKVAEEHNHTYLRKIGCHVEEHNLSDELPVQEEAETSDKLQKHNLSDDLPMRKAAEVTNNWNSKSGNERETINKTACDVRETGPLDNRAAKKQARSEEEEEASGTITICVQEGNTSSHLLVNKQTEATTKAISRSGKEKENGRYSNRISDKKSRKWTPDHVESLPAEKQVEVSYKETNVIIPNRNSVCNEQRGARHEDRRNVHGRDTKSAYHNHEQRAAEMPNMKFRVGGDSEMSISSPDSSNSRSKSRSYSPIVQTEPPYDTTAESNSYMSIPAIGIYDSTVNKAAYQGNYLANSDDSDAFMRKNNHTSHAYIDSRARKSNSSIVDLTNRNAAAPIDDPYSFQPRGNDDSFHGRQMSEEWNSSTERNLVTDMPRQGYLTRYGGLVGDSYLQASRIPLSTDWQAEMVHGGTGADDFLPARPSDVIYSQPASTAPLFGLSGASAQRGSVMDKYAYGLSGPVGSQSSVMDKYAASLDGTNNSRPKSMFPQLYQFEQPGSSGAGLSS